MGATFSTTTSYNQYKNDFELVIRATKDLEHLLETGFGAPSGKTVGLHDKITAAQESHGLSSDTVKKLRYLVTIRNKLVHDQNFNKLPDRAGFAKSYDFVEKELKAKLSGSSSSGTARLNLSIDVNNRCRDSYDADDNHAACQWYKWQNKQNNLAEALWSNFVPLSFKSNFVSSFLTPNEFIYYDDNCCICSHSSVSKVEAVIDMRGF